MNYVIVRRGEQQECYDSETFIRLAGAGHFVRTDQIFDWRSGAFLPAERFAEVEPYLPQKNMGEVVAEAVTGLVGVGIVVAAGALALQLLEGIFSPPRPSPRCRQRAPNREPLEAWKKSYVRERDNYICTYCGQPATQGHVDHKTSRANGGSNLLRNLTWACAPCNQSKGKMNAPQFKRLINQ